MSTNTHFTTALNDWAEVFMARSMNDMVQFIKDAGISMPQLSTLMHLHHRGACGVTDIGEHLGVTSPAASQMIDRMVQQGLLERSEGTEDRRVRQISVTEKGRQLIEKSILARQRWMEDLTIALTALEQEQAIQALDLLTRTARHLKPLTMAGNLQSERVPQSEITDPQ
jgi:DNA-binding MarR family transcriptional regulator